MSTPYLLTLVISPEVEDAVIDWLLETEEVAGFTSYPVSGHGTSIHALSPAEQVTGRRRQVLIQTWLPQEHGEAVVEGLEQAFHGSGMHYWLAPLARAGHLE